MKYSHYKSIITLSIIVILSSCNMKDKKNITNIKKDSVDIESPELIEANEHFTYKGKPINPWVIAELNQDEFIGEENSVNSVNIINSEKLSKYKDKEYKDYSSEIIRRVDTSNGFINGRELKTEDGIQFLKEFGYKWLGKFKNDIHVLRTYTNGGGTLSYRYILFVKFRVEIDSVDGKNKRKLILTKLHLSGLNPEAENTITLDTLANKVDIQEKNNYDNGSRTYEIKL